VPGEGAPGGKNYRETAKSSGAVPADLDSTQIDGKGGCECSLTLGQYREREIEQSGAVHIEVAQKLIHQFLKQEKKKTTSIEKVVGPVKREGKEALQNSDKHRGEKKFMVHLKGLERGDSYVKRKNSTSKTQKKGRGSKRQSGKNSQRGRRLGRWLSLPDQPSEFGHGERVERAGGSRDGIIKRSGGLVEVGDTWKKDRGSVKNRSSCDHLSKGEAREKKKRSWTNADHQTV